MTKQKLLQITKNLSIIILTMICSASACTLLHPISNVFAEDNPVDIEIVEVSNDGSGNFIPWHDITNAMPGETYSAIPRILNKGSIEISTTICLSQSGEDALGNQITIPGDTFIISFGTNWTKRADTNCYDYNYSLSPNSFTEPLFDSITINSNLDNSYQNATFNLHLYAEARGDIPDVPDTPDTPNNPDTGIFTSIFSSEALPVITTATSAIILALIVLAFYYKIKR